MIADWQIFYASDNSCESNIFEALTSKDTRYCIDRLGMCESLIDRKRYNHGCTQSRPENAGSLAS